VSCTQIITQDLWPAGGLIPVGECPVLPTPHLVSKHTGTRHPSGKDRGWLGPWSGLATRGRRRPRSTGDRSAQGLESGFLPDVTKSAVRHIPHMPSFMVQHRPQPEEWPSAYAAWKGFDSPLRGRRVPSSCRLGGHQIWWEIEAGDETDALGHLPGFVAERTIATRVNAVDIP
jgi:hypothetical protein